MSDGRDVCGYEPPAPKSWAERNVAWVVALVSLAVLMGGGAVSYGVATGATGERMAAQEKRIEQVETKQAQTDLVVEKVRDALIKIGEDTAVTRTKVENVGEQVGRVQRRLDSLSTASTGRRIQ